MDPSADELLERAAERANIAHTIFMLLDVDADGIVGVEQVGSRPALRRRPGSPGGANLWPWGLQWRVECRGGVGRPRGLRPGPRDPPRRRRTAGSQTPP